MQNSNPMQNRETPDDTEHVTASGDVVHGNKVGGDMVGGDKITVGDIEGSYNAIGAGASVIVNQIQEALSAVDELEKSVQAAERRLAEAIQTKLNNIAKVAADTNDGRSNPYKALLDYELQDAPFFYGRSDAIKAMQEKMGREKLTILHSESGSGKTSLMQAGLASRLLAAGDFPLYLRPYQQPPAQFIKKAFLPDYATQPELARFRDDEITLCGFLERVTHFLGGRRLIIFLDQFEEFFSELSKEEQQKFADQLRECVESDLSVLWVLALRKEYFSDLRLFRTLKPFENEYFLPAFNLEEAKEVVTEPAKLKGVDYEAGLVDRILEDLREAEEHGQKVERISPAQMQLVCYTLFDELSKEDDPTLITHKFYEIPRGRKGAEKAGAKGILASHLSRVLDNELKGKERKIARHVLEMLVTSDVRRVVRSEGELHEALDGGQVALLNQILETLYDNRLIRRNMNSDDEPIYELAHDYLLTEIKLDPETQARKLAQEMLDYDVKIWQQNLPDKEILIAEDRFNIINDQRNGLRLDAKSKELLDKSQQEIEAERQRQLEDERKRTRIAFAVGVVMLLVAIFAGVQWNSARNSEQDAKDSEATAVAESARALTAEELADKRAVEAEQARSTAVAESIHANARYLIGEGQTVYAADPLLGLALVVEGAKLLENDEETQKELLTDSYERIFKQGHLFTFENIDNVYGARDEAFAETSNSAFSKTEWFILDYTDTPGEMWQWGAAEAIPLNGKVREIWGDPNGMGYVVAYEEQPILRVGFIAPNDDDSARDELWQWGAATGTPLNGDVSQVWVDPNGAGFVAVTHDDFDVHNELWQWEATTGMPLGGNIRNVWVDPKGAGFVVAYDDAPDEMRQWGETKGTPLNGNVQQ
ncbi:MAG: ATP-binding protein, partial [Chloroflexi bacterium]|nr:ATP-binding protein [Chloroflexota bacterium]